LKLQRLGKVQPLDKINALLFPDFEAPSKSSAAVEFHSSKYV